MNSERLDVEQPSTHFGTFARKMDPRISENGPQNHPKVHLGPCHTQARGQRNLEAQNGSPPRCFLVVTCTTWLRSPFWRRSSDSVAAVRLFQGSKPLKIAPQQVHFQEFELSKIVPKRSTLHSPKPVVSADETSVVSAGKTSVVSADKTAAAAADKTSVVSQDIPTSLSTQGRPRSAMPWGCLGKPQMSCLLPQQMSCLLTQQMSCLQTQQMSCLQTQQLCLRPQKDS